MSKLDDVAGKYGIEYIDHLTRYNDIKTFHIYNNGKLTEELNDISLLNDNTPIHFTEYIAGTLVRIIFIDDDFFIGHNADIIHARGDRIIKDDFVIPTYTGITNFLNKFSPMENRIICIYGVVFGNGFNDSERYTSENKTSFRMFDGFSISLDTVQTLFTKLSLEELDKWTNDGHRSLWSFNTLRNFYNRFQVQGVPEIWDGPFSNFPKDPTRLMNWGKNALDSDVKLDEKVVHTNEDFTMDAGDDFLPDIKGEESAKQVKEPEKPTKKSSKYGIAKGMVIRSEDSKYIRKVIFENGYINL